MKFKIDHPTKMTWPFPPPLPPLLPQRAFPRHPLSLRCLTAPPTHTRPSHHPSQQPTLSLPACSHLRPSHTVTLAYMIPERPIQLLRPSHIYSHPKPSHRSPFRLNSSFPPALVSPITLFCSHPFLQPAVAPVPSAVTPVAYLQQSTQ